jgi:hypothetical protein
VKKSLEARASQSLSPKDVNAIAHENLKKRNQHKQAIALINGLKEKQQSEIDAIQETLGDGQTFKTIHQARTALAKNETGDTTAKQQRATVTLAGALRTRQAQNKLEPARRAAQDKKEEQAAKTIQGLYSISKAKKEAQRIKDQQQDKRVEDAQSTIARARKAKKARSDLTQRNQPAILSSDEGASQSLPSGPQQPPSARGGEGKAVSTLEAIVKSNIINPMIETVANHFNSPAAQRESGSGGGHDESGGPGDAPSSRSLSAVAANESPSGAQSSPPAATDANSKGGRDEGTGSTPQQANVNKDSKGNDILDSKSQPNAINLILLGRERAEQQGLQLHSALDAIKLGSLTPQEYQEKLSKQGLAKDIVYDLVKLATDSDQNTTLPNTVSSGGDGQVARKQTSSHQSAERDEAAAEGGGGNPGGAQSSPPAATDANSEGKDLQSPRQSAQGVTGTASGEGGSGEEHIESGSDGGENTNRLSSRPPSVRRTQSLPATFTPANANTQVPAPSNRVHAATQTPYSISVETQTQPPSPSTSSRLSLATVAQPQKPATLTVSTQTNTRGSTTPLLSRTNSSESVSTALDSASSTPVSIATSNASHTNQDPGQLSISQLYTRAYSNTPRGRSKEPRLKTPRTPKSQKPPTADEIARALARLAGNSYKKPTPAASLAPTQPTSPHAVAVTLQGEHRPSALETVETVKPYIPPLRLDAIFKENPSDDPNTGQSSPEAETYSPDQKIVKEFLENYTLHSRDPDSLETIRMRMAIRNLAKQDGDGEFYADMARTLNEQSNSIADALRDGSISDYDKKRAAAMVEQIDRVRKTLKKTAQDDTDRARRDRIEELLDKEGREANLENLNRSPLQEALQKRLKVGKYKPGRFKRMANTLFSPFTRSPKSKDQGTTPLPVSLVQIPSPRSRLIAPPTSPGWLSPTAAWNARDEAANKKGQKRSRHS